MNGIIANVRENEDYPILVDGLQAISLRALHIAKKKGSISAMYFRELARRIYPIPDKVSKVLAQDDKIKYIAAEIRGASNVLYLLGRGYNIPLALEGALKLKENSYTQWSSR